MWYERNDTDDSGGSFGWKWTSWRVPTEYLPLLVALCCGIAIVLLTISALIVWRCCLIPRRKQDYCDSTYCDVASQNGLDASKTATTRDTAVYAMQNGPWSYHSRVLPSNDTMYSVPRSQTMVSMPRRSCSAHDGRCKRRCERPCSQSIAKEVTMIVPPVTSQFQPPMSFFSGEYRRELSPSSSLEGGLDDPLSYSDRSKSTPALEDLYAKVNFSKKRKNRMRKDEAAIIALSKSRTDLDADALALTDGGVVVYNERTAL